MRLLLSVTAVVEGAVGIGLLVAPVLTISILLNAQLELPGGLFAARLCGAAILALSICCWKARAFESHEAAISVITGMLFYNLSAAAVLTYGVLSLGLHSLFIWPVWSHTLPWACGAQGWSGFNSNNSTVEVMKTNRKRQFETRDSYTMLKN